MKQGKAIAILAVLVWGLLPAAEAKKHDLSPAFQSAKTVYVEAADGPDSNPGLYSGDRQAVRDVQDGLRLWGRYTVVEHPEGADLIILVRKGRARETGEDPQPNLPTPTPTPSRSPGGMTGSRTPGQVADPDAISSATELGSDNDRLMVFTPEAYLKHKSPVWTRESKDGLGAPSRLLVGQLKDAVDLAYPPAPPTPPR
jgi:hypothetical protein